MADALDFREIAAYLAEQKQACVGCDICAQRCDILTEQTFNIGAIAGYGADLATYVADLQDAERAKGDAGDEHTVAVQAIAGYAQQNAYLIDVIRSCFLCNQCTHDCPADLKAPKVMVAWRRMLTYAHVIREEDSKSVSIDAEWDLFKVYRRLQGTLFDGIMLPDAQEGQVDALFFPGCSLVSYAPELTQKVWDWLKENDGGTVAMTDACCASPLVSAGLQDRADAFCEKLAADILRAGVKRIYFVCPGCEQRLLQYLPDSVQCLPLPELLLEKGMALDQAPEGLAQPCAVFDSCNDRAMRYAGPVRKLMGGDVQLVDFDCCGANARCCSAGGAVSSYKPAVCDARKTSILQECQDKGIGTILTICPTCASTFAQMLLMPSEADAPLTQGVGTLSYLEAVFHTPIDWEQVFKNLTDMWTGEYAQWVYSVLI